MSELFCDVNKRQDFVLLFDCADGNPNGDPDNDNLPRTDPETGQGLVTDVCLKRKIRNYIDIKKGTEANYKIYIEERGYLVDKKKKAYEDLNIKAGDDKKLDEARLWMCMNFYDVRTFGGVLVGKKGEGYNCGQVRGPIQLTFSRSYDRVFSHDITITRVALENSGEKKRESDEEKATTGTMGRKALLPYGLYRGYGFFNPMLARGTGFSSEDLALFWEAVIHMFDLDRSASRGLMALRGLYIFTHENEYGKAPAHKLFDLIRPVKKAEVEAPRKFSDYYFNPKIEDVRTPEGVTFTALVS